MRLSHKILLQPSSTQQRYFRRAAGGARHAWNWALSRWKQLYAEGSKPTAFGLVKEYNSIKAVQFPWTTEVTKWAPQKSIQDLGDAFTNFFQHRAKYPRFKKKAACKEAFYLGTGAFTLKGKRLRIPKLGWVKLSKPLRFPGTPVSIVIRQEADRWYASVSVDVAPEWEYSHTCRADEVVGVDVGLTHLAVLSTGEEIPNPRALKHAERKLRRAQKAVSRKRKGSANRAKAKRRLGRVHRRVRDLRSDTLHKLTARLVQEYRYIGVEDLHVKGMLKSHQPARALSDAAFGELHRQLSYKSALAGGTLVTADRWFPSSKTCSVCGEKVEKLPLHVRWWTCPHWGHATTGT